MVAPDTVAPPACPFKRLSSEALLDDVHKISSSFTAGCPFAAKEAQGHEETLGKILASLPEKQLNALMSLLRREGESLRARLGIDGSGWEMLLGRASLANDVEKLAAEAARKQRADARRAEEHEATAPLSKRLRNGTKEVHAAAESVSFVREFISGRCPRPVYAAMIKD
eukprot:6946207-Prymnesium_polylepis.1